MKKQEIAKKIADKELHCSKCNCVVHKYEMFPKNQCIDCYSKTPESRQPYSNDLFKKAIK